MSLYGLCTRCWEPGGRGPGARTAAAGRSVLRRLRHRSLMRPYSRALIPNPLRVISSFPPPPPPPPHPRLLLLSFSPAPLDVRSAVSRSVDHRCRSTVDQFASSEVRNRKRRSPDSRAPIISIPTNFLDPLIRLFYACCESDLKSEIICAVCNLVDVNNPAGISVFCTDSTLLHTLIRSTG